jgi:hypothetical protein
MKDVGSLYLAEYQSLLPLQAYTADFAGPGLDIQRYKGAALAVLTAARPAATNTFAVKLQTANNDIHFTVDKSGAVHYNGILDFTIGPDPVPVGIVSNLLFVAQGDGSWVEGYSNTTVLEGEYFEIYDVIAPYGLALSGYIYPGIVASAVNDAITVTFSGDRVWTDIGTSFSTVTSTSPMSTVAGVEVKNSKKLVNVDSLGDYVRAYATVTGTTPSITASVNFLGSE